MQGVTAITPGTAYGSLTNFLKITLKKFTKIYIVAIQFKIRGEFIELIKLLKVTGISESGAQAQALVEANEVNVNGQLETRKRAKIKSGDTVETSGETIIVE